jgi:hypothetical protein
VSAWHGHYCLHLDAAGFPCNRPTMRLGMCDQHREAKPAEAWSDEDRASQRRHNAAHRAKRAKAQATAGLAPAFEGA